VLLLREKGLEHEIAYLDRLRHHGLSVVEIPTDGLLENRAEQTRAAIAAGTDVIYQAAFQSGSWHGFADFLRRVAGNPNQYECVDTKLARTPAPHHLMQLSVYSDLIGQLQATVPKRMHLVLGDGREVTFRTSDTVH